MSAESVNCASAFSARSIREGPHSDIMSPRPAADKIFPPRYELEKSRTW